MIWYCMYLPCVLCVPATTMKPNNIIARTPRSPCHCHLRREPSSPGMSNTDCITLLVAAFSFAFFFLNLLVRQRLGYRTPGPSSTLNGFTSSCNPKIDNASRQGHRSKFPSFFLIMVGSPMRFVPPECLHPTEVTWGCVVSRFCPDAR